MTKCNAIFVRNQRIELLTRQLIYNPILLCGVGAVQLN